MSNTFTDLHVSSTTNNVTILSPSSLQNFFEYFPSADLATVSAATINTDLATNPVVVAMSFTTNNNEPGDIIVDSGSPITWQSSSTLSLDAIGSVVMNDSISGDSALFDLRAENGTVTQNGGAIISVATLMGFAGGGAILTNANLVTQLEYDTGSSNFTFHDAEHVEITSITAAVADLTLDAGADGRAPDRIAVDKLQGTSSGTVTLDSSSNDIAKLGNFAVTAGSGGADFTLVDNVAVLTIDGAVSAHDIAITDVQAGGEIIHEAVQSLVVSGSTSGSFTLTFRGQTTGSIAATASAGDIKAALELLSTIGGVNGSVSVTQVGSTYTIAFGGTLAGMVVPLITSSASGNTVTSVTVADAMQGHDITLLADQMALDSAISATDAITLAPQTAGTQVTLGSGVPAGLVIDNAELSTLTARTLTIGSATAGRINVGTATVGSATLDLVTGNGVLINGALSANDVTITNVLAGGAIVHQAVQNLVVSGSTSGSFTLTFRGATTGSIAATASAADIKTALDLLSTIGGVNGSVTVTQVGSTYTITFGGALAETVVPLITSSASGDTVTSVTVADAMHGHDITLLADQMVLDGAIVATDAIALAPQTAGTQVTLGSGVPTGLVIDNSELSTLTAPTLTIGNATAGELNIGTATIGSSTLDLVTGAGITMPGGTLIVAGGTGTLSITAAGTVELDGAAIEIGAVGGATSSGDFKIAATNAATLTVHAITTAGGEIVVGNSAGAMSVDGAVSGRDVTLSSADSFTLAASGSIASTTGVTLDIATHGSLDGVISGNGGLLILAGGIVTLTATDSYHGITTVASGTLLVDGSIATSVETDVRNGATLGGHGAVGNVHVFGGGTLSPGDSPGVLTTGDVTLDTGAHFHEEIGGPGAGSFDQLQVHGAVNLGGASLDLSFVNGFTPSAGESFKIIDNDGSDAVTSTFAGLAEGAQVSAGGATFALSYHGGDGNDVTLTVLGAPPNPPPGPAPSAVPGDFNADKIGDVLWQGPGSAVAEWLMNGGAIASNLGVSSDAGLHFLDTGDFNADGKSDLLWRDDIGNVTLWTMNGAQIAANQTVANIGGDWQNQGVADFDGDGHADVLWRNGGQVALWQMNGASITSNQIVTANLGSDWHIHGLGDFNDDGKSDVLLRSSSGEVVLWTMNGAQIAANQSIASLGLDWHVLGTGDFNDDGHSDVLLRNNSGQVVLWTMNGAQITANQGVANIDASWHVQGISDYTGDGHADVLWRNDNGQTALWEMDGAHIVSNHAVGYANGQAAMIDASWSVLHHQFDLV